MNSILTPEEIAFLNKVEAQKIKHKEAQLKYRGKLSSNNPNYKTEHNEYIRQYNQQKRIKQNEIKKKLLDAEPKTINLKDVITEPPKIDKRSRKGKKQINISQDITPSHLTRKEPLEYSTIDDYIRKANIIHKIFTNNALSQPVKNELKKLLNDNPNINEKLILNEMKYIKKDIEPTIQTLRGHYSNDNSFKSYINILTVIISHLKDLNDAYQILTKVNIKTNKDIQQIRKSNIINEANEGKIINLDQNIVLQNIENLDNIDDILIYSLYTLFPARRLEYRNLKLTNEKNIDNLKNNDTNFLICSTIPKIFVFNDYKTSKTYGQQVFNIPDDLDSIISKYITINNLKVNDYLFSLQREKKEVISEGNFSKKISNVFYKVYNELISIRYLRMSWSSYIHSKNPSVIEIEKYAEKMAHSPSENILYKKVNIK
jgi:hypothetical protein